MRDGRARRRGPELRRQRLVRALPARRRRRSSASRSGSASSPTGAARSAPPLGKRRVQRAPQPKPRASARRDVSSVRCHKSKIPDVNGPVRRAAIEAEREPTRTGEVTGDPQALARLPGDHRPDRDRRRRGRGLHPRPTSGSRCPAGCRSSARTSSRSRPSCRTAQAVTPGQGQTVNVAGVQVGEISQRRARGRQGASSTLRIEPDVRPRLQGRDACCCGRRPA